MEHDPFDTVRSQVAQTLARAETQQTKWGEARRRKPVRHDECKLLLAELLTSVEDVEADLGDLEEVLAVIERDRSRFPHLDDAEVASRQQFVRSSRRAVLSIRDDLSTHAPKSCSGSASKSVKKGASPYEKQGLLAGDAGGMCSPAGAGGGGGSSSSAAKAAAADREMTPAHDHNADYLESGLALQQAQFKLQEDTLEDLGVAVRRIKSLGTEMNEELRAQKSMLDNLEGGIEKAGEAMTSLKAKMKEMAKSKDRGKWCAILVLSGLLFGLLCLVLYT